MRPRLPHLVRPPGLQVVATTLVALGVLFVPAALIPWAVTAPALAATLLSLALTAQDGLLAFLGQASAGSLSLLLSVWPL